jgi:hypothetical protein
MRWIYLCNVMSLGNLRTSRSTPGDGRLVLSFRMLPSPICDARIAMTRRLAESGSFRTSGSGRFLPFINMFNRTQFFLQNNGRTSGHSKPIKTPRFASDMTSLRTHKIWLTNPIFRFLTFALKEPTSKIPQKFIRDIG